MVKFIKEPNPFAALRKRMGLTQNELAIELNVSRSLIMMVETGRRSFSTRVLLKLASLEMALHTQANDQQAIPNHTKHKNYFITLKSNT